MIDISRAEAFMAMHARLLDRRRLAVVLGRADPATLLDALAAYRNPDGGFGWGLEADQRAPSSQPAGALHAFEVLAEAAPATSEMGARLCDWLQAASLPDGALPFSVAGAAGPGTARWWAQADPAAPSLHITCAVAMHAHHAAAHDPAIAAHPWPARATDWCLAAIAARGDGLSSHELMYALQLVDAAADARPEAAVELDRLASLLPEDGTLPVRGGAEGEALRPLDISPWPERPLRRRMPADAIERSLDALEAGQRDDGGWTVDFPSASPAGALEWRGLATLRALSVLRAHGRLAADPA